MTDTLSRHSADAKPAGGRARQLARSLARSLAYDAVLAPVSAQTLADAMLGEPQAAGRRWRRRAAYRLGWRGLVATGRADEPTAGVVFGYGLISAVLGLMSWFLMLLVVMAVVRGPFWGFVDHGSIEPGTWGEPTRAGAWTAHGLIAVPCIVGFLFVLRGIAALQAQLVRPLYGLAARKWVLPATIVLAAGGLAFFWSWIEQL
ncbi:hypothetical protein EV645_8096 [Kribbella rubisoli]|uniref:Uncharacterized protein n=1 Tax=Kribbella rubisoli TaxID=3075929 RepID=A0A4Q7VZ28_9ACTN|nr:hypothetical protein [Kribbella rubisoli]RZU01980.1 hypothetical protein EV645_8096 [Kribbella rubisoli]